MKLFKNVELADKYKVSEKTIRNWIRASQKGQLKLGLIHESDRAYIADTSMNHIILSDLSKRGRKFKNKNAAIEVRPCKKFYTVFNDTQIIDIITNLEIHGEFPHKYTYFDGGADYWDNYVKRTLNEKISNTVTNTHLLLALSSDYIFSLLGRY